MSCQTVSCYFILKTADIKLKGITSAVQKKKSNDIKGLVIPQCYDNKFSQNSNVNIVYDVVVNTIITKKYNKKFCFRQSYLFHSKT